MLVVDTLLLAAVGSLAVVVVRKELARRREKMVTRRLDEAVDGPQQPAFVCYFRFRLESRPAHRAK